MNNKLIKRLSVLEIIVCTFAAIISLFVSSIISLRIMFITAIACIVLEQVATIINTKRI